jgi:glycosyltransferase involved in cell wall biosynthesis
VRVALDTTYARRAPFSGTAIYLARLQEAWRESGEVEVVAVANERRRPPAGGGLGSVRNLSTDAWWTAVELPRRSRQARAEVIHHPLPAIAPGVRTPQVITVLDLAFERLPAHFSRGYRIYARTTHRAAALAAGAVICISETTAEDVRSLWRVPAEKVVVAPLGPGQQLPSTDGPVADPQHFLYVGDAERRKNLGVLLEAYRRYRERVARPLELVLAGSVLARGAGVRVEQRPSSARLSELYRDAAALVHPSLYEGFGLTPLEAMTVGTPVVAARAPGVTEVCAEAARYAAPEDPEEFAAAMVELGRDPALRRELARLGKERAAQFSWHDCARLHAYAYSLALRA